MSFVFRRKVQPVPTAPREVRLSHRRTRKTVKWFLFILLVAILGIGVWVGYTANRAIKNITADSGKKSSIFSFLGEMNSNIKGKSDGRTNILILGMGGKNHPGGTLSDTMITASINYKEDKLGLINIPRDLWVPISGFGHAKINEAYADGENHKNTAGSGGQLSSKTVEGVLGVPIHYYVSLDFEGFTKLIDTVGGVDVYVDKAINDPYYPAPDMIHYAPFSISAGEHHMDGALALKYVRSRETTSDFDRSRRQQQVMAALKEKVVSLNILANPSKLTGIINILGDHIRTNMSVDEMYALWTESKKIDMTNITSKVLDTAAKGPLTAGNDSRGYYIYPKKGVDNFSEIQTIARNLFADTEEVEESVARIEILNATNRSGVAATVSEYLKSYGYKVAKIGTAPAKADKTIIYLYTAKNQKVADELATKLNGQIQIKEGASSTIDIQVVVGENYLK